MLLAAPDCKYRFAWSGPDDGPPRIDCPLCRVQRCVLCHASPFHTGKTCEEAAAAAKAESAAKAANAKAEEATKAMLDKELKSGKTRPCPKCTSES